MTYCHLINGDFITDCYAPELGHPYSLPSQPIPALIAPRRKNKHVCVYLCVCVCVEHLRHFISSIYLCFCVLDANLWAASVPLSFDSPAFCIAIDT